MENDLEKSCKEFGNNLFCSLSIKSKKVPFRILKNFMYYIAPLNSLQRAFKEKDKLIKKYNLEERDIKIYPGRIIGEY